MRLARSPVLQLVVASTIAFLIVALGTTWFSRRVAAHEAITDAKSLTEVLARSVAEPAVTPGLLDGAAGALDRFDRTVSRRLHVGQVRRIKIWDPSGRIVYSDRTALIGEQFDLGEDERRILTDGGIEAEVSDLGRPENRFEAGSGGMVEVYTRIVAPDGRPLLFEVYLSTATITARERQIVRAFRPVTLSSLVVLLAITLPLVWGVTRRLGRAAEEREVLLQAAADASDAERRRIARDLHDTVVQDLAGTSYALSAAAQRGAADSAELAELSEGVRGSMRALRSLLVEIYPADLHERGLAGALEDLMASASSTGVETSLRVEDVRLDDAGVGLVWRVAQEGVRNALRHARADRLDVELRQRQAGTVSLVVRDDGVGFDPEQPPDEGHFGLRGLRTLIREMGADLQVTSAPGNGTTVELQVRSR